MIARWFWREWRSPSLLIVWLALSLAVACVLALGSISDRMEKGLSQQSREFMAGDRTLRSSREVPAEWIAKREVRADRRRAAELRHHDVCRRYAAAGGRQGGGRPLSAVWHLETQPPGLKPQAGSVLLAPRLMALLNLKTGDTIDVGDATLRIAGK
jgi:putative ABC transport system permease protein